MSTIGESIVFPKPENQKEIDLYQSLHDFINDVSRILNGGIKFSDNVDCTLVSFTSNSTPDTEDTTAHSLGKTAIGFIVYDQDKAGSLYKSKAHDSTNIYTKCDVASVAFKVIVF